MQTLRPPARGWPGAGFRLPDSSGDAPPGTPRQSGSSRSRAHSRTSARSPLEAKPRRRPAAACVRTVPRKPFPQHPFSATTVRLSSSDAQETPMRRTIRLAIMTTVLTAPALAQTAGGGGGHAGGAGGGSSGSGAGKMGGTAANGSAGGSTPSAGTKNGMGASGPASGGSSGTGIGEETSQDQSHRGSAFDKSKPFDPSARTDPVNSSDPATQPKIEIPH